MRVSMPTTALAPTARASAAIRDKARWRVALKMSLYSLISPRPKLFSAPRMPPAIPTE
jgi:hypothetical protein